MSFRTVEIGQIPTRRGEPRTITPPGNDSASLPNAILIADLVYEQYTAGFGVPLSTAVRQADGRIQPDQRFYDVEFKGAAIKLASYKPDETVDVFHIGLKNNMGYRLVDIQACRYGYVVDPVTRECVEETTTPPVIPPDTYQEPPDDTEAAAKIPIWLLVIGGVAGFSMLTQRRK